MEKIAIIAALALAAGIAGVIAVKAKARASRRIEPSLNRKQRNTLVIQKSIKFNGNKCDVAC